VSVAALLAARARQLAIEENRLGRYAGAATGLQAVASRIGSFAGDDPSLHDLMRGLEGDAPSMAAPAAEIARKRMHAQASNVMFSRDADGKAIRRRRS
jgi:hypothetical protein